MIRIFTFLSLLTILSSACKKEELGFTNHAFNSTVSAQLNGEDWFSNARAGISSNRQDSFDTGFSVYKNGLRTESLILSLIPMSEGKHAISAWPDEETRNLLRPSLAAFNSFLEDGDVAGERWTSTADTLYNYCIVDRVDTIKGIIEGRFQVILVKKPERDFLDTPDTLRFEDGRFSAALRN